MQNSLRIESSENLTKNFKIELQPATVKAIDWSRSKMHFECFQKVGFNQVQSSGRIWWIASSKKIDMRDARVGAKLKMIKRCILTAFVQNKHLLCKGKKLFYQIVISNTSEEKLTWTNWSFLMGYCTFQETILHCKGPFHKIFWSILSQ